MRIRQGLEEKSRLGRLLVNRGYLSEAQVEEGLRLQHETGQRLGEIFVQNGWISERELHRVLKHQSRYRNAAALVTLVTLPFQPLVTLAAGSQGASASQQSQVAGELYGRGLSPISDEELGRLPARPIRPCWNGRSGWRQWQRIRRRWTVRAACRWMRWKVLSLQRMCSCRFSTFWTLT